MDLKEKQAKTNKASKYWLQKPTSSYVTSTQAQL
jgi:hypothetical protein